MRHAPGPLSSVGVWSPESELAQGIRTSGPSAAVAARWSSSSEPAPRRPDPVTGTENPNGSLR
ncbi:hypothetical protein [Nocardia neocaledoniensis]|uniref:hypothetical protein n=1 Tax=Nocardia neocaledoniensis TaxID=236511 RepID=UPI0024551CAC|nr:hypothetical protein [Nocardia neocaledoniensis]